MIICLESPDVLINTSSNKLYPKKILIIVFHGDIDDITYVSSPSTIEQRSHYCQ